MTTHAARLRELKDVYEKVVFNEREIKRVENALIEPLDKLIKTPITLWADEVNTEKLLAPKAMNCYAMLFFIMFRLLIPAE